MIFGQKIEKKKRTGLPYHIAVPYRKRLKNEPRKINNVDAVLLYDDNITMAFYHIWKYHTPCYNNDIVFNSDKVCM